MSRYTSQPGEIGAFGRVRTFVVWKADTGAMAICASKEDADRIAALLNADDTPVADPEVNLCPRGGDHYVGKYGCCLKCGARLFPF